MSKNAVARLGDVSKPPGGTPRYAKFGEAPRPMRVLTIQQAEEAHPALKGRLRAWIHRADANHPEYAGLRIAVVRVGRSLLIDEVGLLKFLYERSAMPPSPSRRGRLPDCS